MKNKYLKSLAAMVFSFAFASVSSAQTAPAAPAADQAPAAAAPAAAPAAPMALPTPSMSGPLSAIPPAVFDAGPLGKLDVNAIVDGMGLVQGYHVPVIDGETQAALSNGFVFLQKADGKFQYFVQAGAYNLPALGAPFVTTNATIGLYGAVPVAFAKWAGKTTSVQIGQLPTLIGAESTFTFQNMNVERGVLWGLEPAISRGVQLNQAMGKYLSASLSWNDGFYSDRYNWLSGSLTYTKGANMIEFVGTGNAGQTNYKTGASTALLNNSMVYNVIYMFTKGSWIVEPYYQYTDVPVDAKIGVPLATSTNGGALLLSKTFKHGFALAGRVEDLQSSGSSAATSKSANILGFGPGSGAWSFTATPTFQYGGLFFRGDISVVGATSPTPGDELGPTGTNKAQPRGVGEIGFIFGNNLAR